MTARFVLYYYLEVVLDVPLPARHPGEVLVLEQHAVALLGRHLRDACCGFDWCGIWLVVVRFYEIYGYMCVVMFWGDACLSVLHCFGCVCVCIHVCVCLRQWWWRSLFVADGWTYNPTINHPSTQPTAKKRHALRIIYDAPAPISPAPSTATVPMSCLGLPCLLCFRAVVPLMCVVFVFSGGVCAHA